MLELIISIVLIYIGFHLSVKEYTPDFGKFILGCFILFLGVQYSSRQHEKSIVNKQAERASELGKYDETMKFILSGNTE
jgi:hypothetical protein